MEMVSTVYVKIAVVVNEQPENCQRAAELLVGEQLAGLVGQTLLVPGNSYTGDVIATGIVHPSEVTSPYED